ncbi:TPA: VOC family protein [Candidatus Avigastranaerophilus faecigallinarum]|nr:VOC family protein [Candidatus Avigastranaerophilus faecigallinarum]
MKFLHSMIRVKNINDSLKFYNDFLGLKLIEKKALEDCDLYFLGENENSCQIELTYNYDTPTDGYKNGNAFGHFAFAVDNMNLVCEKVKEFGYEFLWEPFELSLKNEKGELSKKLIAFIKDPDGNEIELIQE